MNEKQNRRRSNVEEGQPKAETDVRLGHDSTESPEAAVVFYDRQWHGPLDDDFRNWAVVDEPSLEDDIPGEEPPEEALLVWHNNPYVDDLFFSDSVWYRITKWHVEGLTIEQVSDGLEATAKGLMFDQPGNSVDSTDEPYYEMCKGTIYLCRDKLDKYDFCYDTIRTALCDVESVESDYASTEDGEPLEKRTRRMVNHLCSHSTREHVT